MSGEIIGTLSKMRVQLNRADPAAVVNYELPVGDRFIALNERLGQRLTLNFQQEIRCVHCDRKTKKSFNQGYCFPCFRGLAQCDTCIVKPETCHYAEGTCREPDWAQLFCFTGHTVYLANSSGLKVGITRNNQLPTRWIDQGAIQALPVFAVKNRFHSGLVETTIGNYVADKTRWQAMLKNQVETLDMRAERERVLEQSSELLQSLEASLDDGSLELITDAQPLDIRYPVLEYPTKVTSLNLDKTPQVAGTLLGIKGQYLILDTGVLNIRKFGGYVVQVD